MKLKSWNSILKSVVNLALIGLLLLSVAAWRGQIFGISLKKDAKKEYTVKLDLDDCKVFFPGLVSIQKVSNLQFNLFDHSGELLGYAFAYKGEHGYGGRVPLITFTNEDEVICGVLLGENFESKSYLSDIIENGILYKWNGISRNKVSSIKVDAIAGATITSQAIISGVQNSATTIQTVSMFKLWSVENMISLFLLGVFAIVCFFPKRAMKYRTVLQVLSIVVFGFWLGRLISFVQIIYWISGGVNWQIQFIMIILLTLSIVIPIIFGKAFYCTWVCPFGAAQELCGKACSKKIQIPAKGIKLLKPLRERIFLVLLVSLWVGFSFDLTLIEPFTIFSIKHVDYWIIGFASVFLIIGAFIPKAWCRFFCPVGFVLEWIRK